MQSICKSMKVTDIKFYEVNSNFFFCFLKLYEVTEIKPYGLNHSTLNCSNSNSSISNTNNNNNIFFEAITYNHCTCR